MLVGGFEEKVQIVDFGLAKVPVEEPLADRGNPRGARPAKVRWCSVPWPHLAPEAALGMRSIDRRSRTSTRARVILYEMLAGRHPFTASDSAGGCSTPRHKQMVPPPLRERAPEVSVPPAGGGDGGSSGKGPFAPPTRTR